jgi:hypothetical protein
MVAGYGCMQTAPAPPMVYPDRGSPLVMVAAQKEAAPEAAVELAKVAAVEVAKAAAVAKANAISMKVAALEEAKVAAEEVAKAAAVEVAEEAKFPSTSAQLSAVFSEEEVEQLATVLTISTRAARKKLECLDIPEDRGQLLQLAITQHYSGLAAKHDEAHDEA